MLTVIQLVKEFRTSYGNGRYIVVFARAHQRFRTVQRSTQRHGIIFRTFVHIFFVLSWFFSIVTSLLRLKFYEHI
jgi:hypothetical protein